MLLNSISPQFFRKKPSKNSVMICTCKYLLEIQYMYDVLIGNSLRPSDFPILGVSARALAYVYCPYCVSVLLSGPALEFHNKHKNILSEKVWKIQNVLRYQVKQW